MKLKVDEEADALHLNWLMFRWKSPKKWRLA